MNREVYAGLLFLAFGGAVLWFGREYRLGTAVDMGPGYFPALLGGLLVVLGGALVIGGVLAGGSRPTIPRVRPLVSILAAVVAFGLLIEAAGLVAATIVAVVLGSTAGWRFRLWEAALLGVVLAGLVTGVFVYGLGLPFRVW
jgi:hypothetical protein